MSTAAAHLSPTANRGALLSPGGALLLPTGAGGRRRQLTRDTRLGYDVAPEGPPSARSAPARPVGSIDIERLARSVRVPLGRLVMSSVAVDQTPTAGERKAREVAEAARERQWTRRLAGLFG